MSGPRALLLAVAVLVGGAAAVDVVWPSISAPPVGERVAPAAGTLACPFGASGASPSYLHLFNAGDQVARARITIVPDAGEPVVLSADVEASRARTIRMRPGVRRGAAVFIDHSGGALVASHTMRSSSRVARGVGAGTCQRAGPAVLAIAHGRTAGMETSIAVANPGAADADVTISLFVDGRPISPESLTGRVVPARSRRVFSLSDFAFEAADLTAFVESSTGRVVAEAQISSSAGLAFLSGGPPSRDVLQLVAATSGARAVSIGAVGLEEESGLDARVMTAEQLGRAAGVPPTIEPADSVRLSVPEDAGDGAAAFVLSVAAGSPLATGATWVRTTGGGSDRGTMEGVEPARRWAGVLGTTEDRSDTRALLANPSDRPARVRLTIVVGEETSTDEIVIPAGRLVDRRLSRGQGTFGIAARADAPIVMALLTNTSGARTAAFGATASPQVPPGAVAVRRDERVGVPAPLPEFED